MRTTGIQVSGFGFLLRRLELALVIGDARMAHDPLRNQRRAIAVGVLLSLLIAGGAVMLGLLKPKPSLDGDLVADEFGSLHVKLGEAYHPITNVASARLVLGTPAEVTKSTSDQLADVPTGSPIGIGHVPGLAQAEDSEWFVCTGGVDSADKSQVHVRALPEGEASSYDVALVRSGQEHWLLNGTSKSQVDAVASRAFGVTAVPVTEGFLKQFDHRDASELPSGKTELPAPFDEAGKLFSADERLFVTTSNGVAELRGAQKSYAQAVASGAPMSVALTDVLAKPSAQALPMVPSDDLEPGQWASVASNKNEDGTLCAGEDGPAVVATSADKTATAEEGTQSAGDTAGFVGPRGTSPIITERGIFLIDDAGLRYSVGTTAELQALGFTDPVQVPWRIVAGLTDAGHLSETNARLTTAATKTTEKTRAKESGTT